MDARAAGKVENMISRTFYLAAALLLVAAPAASAQTIASFPIPTSNSAPGGIATGPDGNLWFTEISGNKIGRLTPAGVITEFSLPTARSGPGRITAGPDGALWFVEAGANRIGRITVDGAVSEFPLPTADSVLTTATPGIGAGPDGNIWFAAIDGQSVGRITPLGAVTEFQSAGTLSGAGAITAGPDANLWYLAESAIGRVTPGGAIANFSAFTTDANVGGIAAGADGALWFSQGESGGIGRVTTAGTVTEIPIAGASGAFESMLAGPDGDLWFFEDTLAGGNLWRLTVAGSATKFPLTDLADSVPQMTVGPDGAIWLALNATNRILRFEPFGAAAVNLDAAVLPGSRSVTFGATATVFATLINSGTTTASDCAVAPVTSIPALFRYQTTNGATGAPNGSPDTPVSIPPGGQQSFLLSFLIQADFSPMEVSLGFACSNGDAAPLLTGVDTLLLSASQTPVPDLIALAATSGNDGIVDLPGATGIGAFAVAIANVGAGGMISASVDTGSVTLPVALTLCQTDPSTGVCRGAPAASVPLSIPAGATPTFSVFAAGSGAIPFAPGTSRVFVRLTDASGAVRGATSVAIRTR
jgi:virginiamycin B lyase